MPTENITLTERYKRVAGLLDPKEFEIPRGQPDSRDDFPTYLKKQLDQYIAYYTNVLMPLIEDENGMPFGEGKEMNVPVLEKSLLANITTLTQGINQTIECYYDGRLLQANQAFREALNHIGFNHLTSVSGIPARCDFYRTRLSSDRRLTREELFHNPFENRGRVATSRYSIPGLPALYLGDSIYVCWEEYRRKKMDDLYFSRFHNTKSVRVVKIQRIEDFLKEIETPITGATPNIRLMFLARYLAVFPLCIACSIKTKSDTDTFKPEYIIPQLLLQYVTTEKGVAGIKFPSTRINYHRIQGVPAYNYVFPVKESRSTGYCTELVDNFLLTEPTSVEIESLLNSAGLSGAPAKDLATASDYISLVDGVHTPYRETTFGRMEVILRSRDALSIYDF